MILLYLRINDWEVKLIDRAMGVSVMSWGVECCFIIFETKEKEKSCVCGAES